MSIFPPPDLQSEGGHGLIPVRGGPGTGDRAPTPETGDTIPHALARWSAGRGRRSESGGRKAFQHPRARHSAVSHSLFNYLNDPFDGSVFSSFKKCFICLLDSLQYDSLGGPAGQANATARCCLLTGRVWGNRVYKCKF